MLNQINLSLSLACGADCLYCPSNRGRRIKQKNMPFELVKKIIDEVSSEDFKSRNQIKRVAVGELGDALMNKEAIEILRYIKYKMPKIEIEIFNTFHKLDKEIAKVILSERLIDKFNCNIDGSNEKDYFLVKKIDFKTIQKNIIDFLELRKELKNESGLTIIILTLNAYIKTINKYFHFKPTKLEDFELVNIPDDSLMIKRQWENILNHNIDRIYISRVCGWAEREKVNCQEIDYQKYFCPLLERVKQEAFIAPDGTWYACCIDSDCEVVFGNVATEGIENIYSSKVRANIIEMLEKKEFEEIGGPCKTVNCCQTVQSKTILERLGEKFFEPTWFIGKFKTIMKKPLDKKFFSFIISTLNNRVLIQFIVNNKYFL